MNVYTLHTQELAMCKHRAALEEQYAKGLLKLSKSTFGDMEEG